MRPEADKAADAALAAARSVGDDLEKNFHMEGLGAGQRILFVPETPQEMEEAMGFLRSMREKMRSAIARDADGNMRRTAEGKPLLGFDVARYRSGSESNDATRQWVEAWNKNFADTMRYFENAVSKYTDGVRLNALLNRHGADGARVDLGSVLTDAERANLLKLSDGFAYVVSEFLDMANANRLMLPEEVMGMTMSMRRDLWTLRRQLGEPEKFEGMRERLSQVQAVYNSQAGTFRKPFGEEERAAFVELAMRLAREGRDIASVPTNTLVNDLYLRPHLEAVQAGREAATQAIKARAQAKNAA